MSSAKDYRDYAIECMEFAKAAKRDDECSTFLQMAMVWLRAASIAEPMKIAASNVRSCEELK